MNATPGRLLTMLSLLQARRDWPGQLLAERLEVSPRTVRRDVDRLRELGYPIRATKGPDGGYQLAAGSALPPLLFDDEQAVALAVALQLAAADGAVLGDGAARALATVRQVLPTRLRHRVDALAITTVPDRRAAPVDPGVLVTATAAAGAREVLRFDYEPAPGTPAPPDGAAPPARRVEPHDVVARGGRWYLVAWDLDRGDWRTFRLDRMAPRTPTGPRFVPRPLPGGDAATFVGAHFKGATGADAWPCRGEVVLALPADQVAPYVTGSDAVVEPLDDGHCRLTMGAWSWAGLAASIGRFDADVDVLGPPELREAFTALARRYAAAGYSR